MSLFQKLSAAAVIALLTGVMIFSACNKKKDNEITGSSAATSLCGCLDSEDVAQIETCASGVLKQIENYKDNKAFVTQLTAGLLQCPGALQYVSGLLTGSDSEDAGASAAADLCECFELTDAAQIEPCAAGVLETISSYQNDAAFKAKLLLELADCPDALAFITGRLSSSAGGKARLDSGR